MLKIIYTTESQTKFYFTEPSIKTALKFTLITVVEMSKLVCRANFSAANRSHIISVFVSLAVILMELDRVVDCTVIGLELWLIDYLIVHSSTPSYTSVSLISRLHLQHSVLRLRLSVYRVAY